MHARRLLDYNEYNIPSPMLMMIGDVLRTRNVLCFNYRENTVGGISISDHLGHITLDEDEEHELMLFSIVICFFALEGSMACFSQCMAWIASENLLYVSDSHA